MTVRTYYTPESMQEALELKARHGFDLHVIAGGTLLMPQINDGLFFPELVMGLRNAGMDKLTLNDAGLSGRGILGATSTMSQMRAQTTYPILQEAAKGIGGWAVQNMATIGGNLFNQPPYGDFAVALLALGAQVKIQSASSERVVDLNEFLTGGRQMAANELVTEIHIPEQVAAGFITQTITGFKKFGPRAASAATIVSVAAQIDLAEDVIENSRIALGGADTTARRSPAAEAVLNNASTQDLESLAAAAARAAADSSEPISNATASAWYRRQMIEVQLKHLLGEMLESAVPAA
ncbi:MAG: FAD binding domain-containing protein [Candidatus Promineifilaceae bacterium]